MNQGTPDQRQRILVVDDEPHIVRVVALKMQNAGFEVATAADGEEAYEAALEFAPHLIITDFTMPFMTGLDLSIKLRRDERTKDIPVVMLTARGYGLPREDLEKTNIKTVMSKPFGPRDLLATVESILMGGQGNPGRTTTNEYRSDAA